MKAALKPFLILAIGGFLLSIVSLVIWISVNKDDFEGLVFGNVVSVGPSVMAITDREERVTTVLISTGTVITDRLKIISIQDILVGQFVQVVGSRVNDHTIKADAVRFMRPRKEKSNEVPH